MRTRRIIFLDIHYMQCFPPSKLAAAVIAASRLQQGLAMWSKQLEDLTTYTTEDIVDPMRMLMKE